MLTEPRLQSTYIVAKFGGTSVATAAGWATIRDVVLAHRAAGRRLIVVCSAVAGVTNLLVAVADRIANGDDPAGLLLEIRARHHALAASMGVDATTLLSADEQRLEARCRRSAALSAAARAEILAHGELMSTRLGAAWLGQCGIDAALLDARTVLRATRDTDRDERYLSATCAIDRGDLVPALDEIGASVIVTQGFIASNDAGETVVLGRGGSDTSGAYFAAGSAALALEVWTDVPGMFTADPRHFSSARLLRRLSFREAETAGCLGAKVLHPRTIEPMRRAGIPIRIRWTAHPDVEGTVISLRGSPHGAKAIVSRRDLALIAMWRPSSWQPIGFMAEVAATFRAFGLSMDLISSSPSEIRVTIDLAAFPSARADLAPLCEKLETVCRPRVLTHLSCVSIVGAGIGERMIAAGTPLATHQHVTTHLVTRSANGDHISFVVDPEAEAQLVAVAHAELLTHAHDASVFGPRWDELQARLAQAAHEPAIGTLPPKEMSA